MWSPPTDWVFDVSEIPTHHTLDDYTVGLLEFVKGPGDGVEDNIEEVSFGLHRGWSFQKRPRRWRQGVQGS